MDRHPVLFMVGLGYKDNCLIDKSKVYKQKRAAEKEAKKRNEEDDKDEWGVVTFTPSGFNKA